MLESPSLPPSIPTHQFKLFLVGRTGSGKTCLVSWLAGLQGWSYTLGESPGVRVTQVGLILTQLDNILTQLYSTDLLALFADSETRNEPAGHIQTPLLGRGGQCGEILFVMNIRVIRLRLQVRKYGHVYPVCREGAAAVILTFSFTDRTTWEELPALIQRTLAAGAGEGVESILPIVVGTK
mgnify:FL=1